MGAERFVGGILWPPWMGGCGKCYGGALSPRGRSVRVWGEGHLILGPTTHFEGQRVFELPVAGFERTLCPESVFRGFLLLGDAAKQSGDAEGLQSAGDGGLITVLTAHCILLLPKDLQLARHLQEPLRGSV